MRRSQHVTLVARRGFTATFTPCNRDRRRRNPPDERVMNANSRKLNAKSLNRP
jgi:hypothetical protein